MCGIAGFVDRTGSVKDRGSVLRKMTAALTRRGPDDEGYFIQEEAGVCLGFRRLAIIDLTPSGKQPMTSASGRYVLVMNGEIYNHLDIRRNLSASAKVYPFRGSSDTESLLAAIDLWGLEGALKQAVGMFALAVYDRELDKVILARDRFGEKPLYYSHLGSQFSFASELRGLAHHPKLRFKVDRASLTAYMELACVPSPMSIFEGIFKLPPGSYVVEGESDPVAYWKISSGEGPSILAELTEESVLQEAERLLTQSVQGQMMSDVPLGAFLSGGIDSSLIVAIMQSLSSRPTKTFTIGFEEEAYDESTYAKDVAKALKTDHSELILSEKVALESIIKIPDIYDEPFADASQVPTYLVSKLARGSVTVSLSGDGGDEVFGGYNRYVALKSFGRFQSTPLSLRRAMGKIMTGLKPTTWDRIAAVGASLGAKSLNQRWAGEKIYKLSSLLKAESPDNAYRTLVTQWPQAETIVLGGLAPSMSWFQKVATSDPFRMGQLKDINGYLPDDILVKVDRAAMSVSLETRAPFLDHRLAEFSLSLPTSWHYRDGQTKWILRQLLTQHVDKELIDRPKTGFGLPIGQWLRHDLKDWAENLLSEKRLKESQYFKVDRIRRAWSIHQSGRANLQYPLWTVLMFEAWLDQWKGIIE